MPRIPKPAQTEGSSTFDPDRFFEAWSKEELTPPYDNNFRRFIIRSFGLPYDDDYGYRATTEVTLLQAQTHVEFGAQGGLHAWYRDESGVEREPPPARDIAAYTDIFRPGTNTAKSLVGLASNAKKDSIRAEVSQHLQSLYSPPSPERKDVVVPKLKSHTNPYFDLWAWSNQNLEWGGPEPGTVRVKHSHAILPVIYHHFGCVCPSYEALSLIVKLANGRDIIDMGSGNGYWTCMLRNLPREGKKTPPTVIVPVDSGLSEWRTMWIGDTIEADGVKWLTQHDGGKDAVLLLVYPNTGEEFTSKIIKAYRGTTIIAASSQNSSGFTAFATETIAQWMEREMPEWEKLLQIPLPSFAGKDEALFAFQKKS